jgi:arylsulfatase
MLLLGIAFASNACATASAPPVAPVAVPAQREPSTQLTAAVAPEVAAADADQRPNILLIVADDLGFSDLGAFGGEIRTPNLDGLAQEGRLLTDHHTAPTCSPTRAMLYSGADHHLVGLGSMAERLSPEQIGKPGYEGYLNQRALSFADLLHDSGYHTYISGKWHLGRTPEQSPQAWGFEHSFVLVNGAASHFAPDAARETQADKNVIYRQDGAETQVPADFFSSNFYTDKLISYLEQTRGDGKPFLALATYTAPHWPLQAPDDFIDRYKGQYDVGYDEIRKRRIERQKALGVIPADFEPHAPNPSTEKNPAWNDLTPEQKQSESRRMEVYAAMVENLDFNVGKLLSYLKRSGQYDNTFVFFQSDNGAEGGPGFATLDTNDNSYANLGKRYSNVAYGLRWGEVSAAPYRPWKAHTTEGGVIVPAIARLPKQKLARAPFAEFTHVTDLAPTFIELASATNPGSQYKGREVYPITGKSILPRLTDRAWAVHADGELFADELFGRRYVRRNHWKLLYIEKPFGTGTWTLYNLWQDPGENHDVAAQHPDIVATLRAEWDAYAKRVHLVLPSTGPGR